MSAALAAVSPIANTPMEATIRRFMMHSPDLVSERSKTIRYGLCCLIKATVGLNPRDRTVPPSPLVRSVPSSAPYHQERETAGRVTYAWRGTTTPRCVIGNAHPAAERQRLVRGGQCIIMQMATAGRLCAQFACRIERAAFGARQAVDDCERSRRKSKCIHAKGDSVERCPTDS